MKIKKFPQSCILVETNGVRILIDPSTVKYEESFLKDWQIADAVLVTHRHSDHIHVDVLVNFKMPIYSTSEVAKAYPDLKINIIKEGDKFKTHQYFEDMKELNGGGYLSSRPLVSALKSGPQVVVTKAIHGFITADGEILENVGYILDDGKTRLYITSDTIRFNNSYKADVLFANVTAFDASMNLWGAVQTYKDTGAKLLIVAHQDGGRMMYEKEKIEKYLSEQKINFIIPNTCDEFEI